MFKGLRVKHLIDNKTDTCIVGSRSENMSLHIMTTEVVLEVERFGREYLVNQVAEGWC